MLDSCTILQLEKRVIHVSVSHFKSLASSLWASSPSLKGCRSSPVFEVFEVLLCFCRRSSSVGVGSSASTCCWVFLFWRLRWNYSSSSRFCFEGLIKNQWDLHKKKTEVAQRFLGWFWSQSTFSILTASVCWLKISNLFLICSISLKSKVQSFSPDTRWRCQS